MFNQRTTGCLWLLLSQFSWVNREAINILPEKTEPYLCDKLEIGGSSGSCFGDILEVLLNVEITVLLVVVDFGGGDWNSGVGCCCCLAVD